MEKINLKTLKKEAEKEIEKVKDIKTLDGIYKRYLGKKGNLTQILRSLQSLPKAKRVEVGKQANELKNSLKAEFDEKIREIQKKLKKESQDKEWIDITRPGQAPTFGHSHPITLVKRGSEEIFQAMGFTVVEGPDIETEWYNFDTLNIPKDHPARDLWDTFWLKDLNLVLRTHTSPVQVRYMEKNNPPIRIIAPGRIFRHEATDAKHETNFYQVEGLMIDKEISVANFKAIIQEFLQRFFNQSVKIRLRPCYFPFTEPSFEIDITCTVCGGKGCSTCLRTGWMEMMGAGMVHPNVLKAAGLNAKNWQGFAFGIGLDRLAMMKYKINDIRLFYSGDLRFLKQFLK